jgi:hypothetical protein
MFGSKIKSKDAAKNLLGEGVTVRMKSMGRSVRKYNYQSQNVKISLNGYRQCCGSGSGRIGIILADPDLFLQN